MVSDNDGKMDVIAGNYVVPEEAESLVHRVNELQSRSPEELRKLYRERLRQSPDETSKGASLGTDLARKTVLRYGVTISVKNDRGQSRTYQRRRDTNSKQLRE